jgi:alpha-beta hydrolase superfamily lysophospholipase
MGNRSRVCLVALASALVAGPSAADAAAARAPAKAHHHAGAKRKAAPKRRKQQAAPARAVTALPVSFTVRNTNTSLAPCSADGRTYVVKGHLIGPAATLADAGPKAVALYVHGLGYGEFFWDYQGIAGYDYATLQATERGLISVAIDRLGYGASGRPDGNAVCYGSEADYLHQIVDQLRSGRYAAGAAPAGPSFRRVALVGHSAGGFMVELAASSFRNVDALVTAGFSNLPSGLPIYTAFGQTTLDCASGALPDHYAYFGKTPADFRAGHFFDADPAVEDAIVALHAPDPCQDTGSAAPAIVVDVLRNNSVKVPTLIVNGGDDALFPFPDGPAERSLFVGNRDVTQVTVPQTGHAVTFGRTAPQFRRTVGDWLKGHGY